MAKPYTNAEWKDLFQMTLSSLKSNNSETKPKKYPDTASDVAKYIDHTNLKLDATETDISNLCGEARKYGFAAVCVRPNCVEYAKNLLKGTNIGVACVIGFHEGTQPLDVKEQEAQIALIDGATELDIVLNRDMLKAGDFEGVYRELYTLREVANRAPRIKTPPLSSPPLEAPYVDALPPSPTVPDTPSHEFKTPVVLKLILETSDIDQNHIVQAAMLAQHARFEYIKTSTGFCGRGASLEDIEFMARVVDITQSFQQDNSGKKLLIKASGGVKDFGTSLIMIRAGATRIGTSSGVAIVKEAEYGFKSPENWIEEAEAKMKAAKEAAQPARGALY